MTANPLTLCCVISHSGLYGEPLACGYVRGHAGNHSWATLPTFVNGEPVSAELPVMYTIEVQELIQAGIEATNDTARTARLIAALKPFGAR